MSRQVHVDTSVSTRKDYKKNFVYAKERKFNRKLTGTLLTFIFLLKKEKNPEFLTNQNICIKLQNFNLSIR